ncbi:putative U-box domain-containing protein 50 [Phoenix dactylifera]|uniref:U-box domain-containing protein 50 n=1 Tax=Phoenix dactylifera TaxID=42345 RepID=A0A8B9AA97_PHODC|nr:putative U-box domain-containing protein 50 [Phoenix dactylifera]
MAVQQEKVYVAVGKDLQQGLGTLGWALRNWSSQSVSFVILHVSVSKDLIYTPFGKLPTSSVNDEMLEDLRMREKDTVDKLLGKYMAFCSKVLCSTDSDATAYKLLGCILHSSPFIGVHR